MFLAFRLATPADQPDIERLVLAAFEPITWQKKLDARFGPLNGHDWQARWRQRLEKIFATQIVLVGETASGELAAVATATIDREAKLGFIDVLAVSRDQQGQGLGRAMLRAAMEHLRSLGCQYVNLDCLTDNESGNALYASEGFAEVARHVRWFRKI
ncbi:MAG TPA: GNAT family N-acetyltransferase [Pirellulaceae bacterium]|nr:GNAT family N-acetyltransferase [Pirellulaceae bacterium]